jgi:DNA repair protein RadC
MVLASPVGGERFHAVFVDARRGYLYDTAMGHGSAWTLTVRMRELFGKALAAEASGMIVAHNHPSGDCRPSQADIQATSRLNDIAKALDIELLDHLIITESAVYSMRAGGNL